MRHQKSGRKFNRSSSHRTAMFRSMTLALIENEKIKTTPAKAKELRKHADKVITLAKKGDLNSRRQIIKILGSTQNSKSNSKNRVRLAIHRVYDKLVPRFKDRAGGYTQMFRIGRRAGDNSEICLMQFLQEGEPVKKKAKKKAKAKGDAKKAKGPEDKPAKPKKMAKPKAPKAETKAKKEGPQDKPASAKKK